MTNIVAKLSFAACAALLAGTLLFLEYNSSAHGGSEVKAEFRDAFPLLNGMNVRISGAISGTVSDIELTDHGTAMVTMKLFDSSLPPHADASASIRQDDLTGDSSVWLELGHSHKMLGEKTIPVSRTLKTPRLDDLVQAFGAPVRDSARLVLVELGRSIEGRGVDLNEAALDLRPGLKAATKATAELASQNAALRSLIADLEDVSGQAASERPALGRMIGSLDATLTATSAHLPALDEALAGAPATLQAGTGTLTRLAETGRAGLPLARVIERAAPQITLASRNFGPFMDGTEVAVRRIGPTLGLARSALRRARPTLLVARKAGLLAPLDLVGRLGNTLDVLLGQRDVVRSLLGADSYGKDGGGNDVGLGAIGVERGDLFGYEGSDPLRRFARAAVVLSCESFGVKIQPGCLASVIGGLPRKHTSNLGPGGSAGNGHGDATTPAQPGAPTTVTPDPQPLVPIDGLGGIGDTLNGVGQGLGAGPLVPGSGHGQPPAGPSDLLDFLLGQ